MMIFLDYSLILAIRTITFYEGIDIQLIKA